MDTNVAEFFVECEEAIQSAYTEGVSMEQAEKLAAKFLHAQIKAGAALREADLDARMRKTGVKAVKAAVYLEEAKKGDKKPSDVMLEAIVNNTGKVKDLQNQLDTAEAYRDQLVNYLSVFREGHIYFRGIAKGNFNG